MANPLQAQTSVPPHSVTTTTTRVRTGMSLLNLELGEPAGVAARIPSLSRNGLQRISIVRCRFGRVRAFIRSVGT